MSINFKTFITEGKSVAETTAQRTHLEHGPNLAFDGHGEVENMYKHFMGMHNYLLGKKQNTPNIETKFDGAPAAHLIMGKDGNVGVATKGVFNKNPKIAWSHDDVDKLYGHAPGLAAVMHDVLDHGPKVLPKNMKPGEILKADVLFGGDRPQKNKNGNVSFQPNLLNYNIPSDTNEGAQAKKAKLGLVFHTHFDRNGRAGPISPKMRDQFRDHPDVYNADPRIKADPANYTPDEQKEFLTHMENATREYKRLKPEAYDDVGHHSDAMRAYAAGNVWNGKANEPLSTKGYVDFLNEKHKKDIEKYKTPGTIDRKTREHAANIEEVLRNQDHFDKMFNVRNHMTSAKMVALGVMDKNNPSHVELPNGEPTRHEGYVSTLPNGSAIKHVDEGTFAFNNKLRGAMVQAKQNVSESYITEASFKLDVPKHVTFIGRTQPPHAGHLQAIQSTIDHADNNDATHTILLTHTHDKNNPLTPEQKLYYAKKSFPDANIQMTDKENPSLLHHASDLYRKGIRDFTAVAGPERLDSYMSLLQSYNGKKGPHGFYNFKNIQGVSSGDRDPDAGGVEGASGTGMKKAAASGDFETFSNMASPNLSDKDKMRMFNDVRSGMAKFQKSKKEKFDPGTPVYVQHGSHSKQLKESQRVSFKELSEAKKKTSSLQNFEKFTEDPNYKKNRENTLNDHQQINDHISPGGSDNVDGVLRKHFGKGLTSKDKDNLGYYSNQSFETNMDLYYHHNSGGDPNQLPEDADHEHIRALDKAINRNKTPKPMTVFSGVGFNPGAMAAKHPKKQLYMPSYTSTSIDPQVATNFAKPLKKGFDGDDSKVSSTYMPDKDTKKEGADHHVLRIDLPAGHPAAYMPDHSEYEGEKELLLARQQTMKIKPKPEIREFEHNGVTHRMHIWDAAPVSTNLPKPKNIKEEMTTGDVRGLGYVTGDPMVSDNFQNNWTNLNRADADTRDQILGANKKHLHDELHSNLKQKLADRKARFADMFYQAAKGKK